MLREFAELLDRNGSFNDKYEQIIDNPNKMGPALYSFYLEFYNNSGTDKLVNFLAAFRNVIQQQSLIPGGMVYRKLKHVHNLIKIDMGIQEKTYAQIRSNAGKSFVDRWICEWEKSYERQKEENHAARAQHIVNTLNF